MPLRIASFITLLVAALGLTMGAAHLLELPVRMHYDPQLYLQVTSTLYRYFGLVGGSIQVLALLLSIQLVWRMRGRAGFRWALAGALCLALSLLLWFLLVQPVNAAWSEVLQADPADPARRYAELRNRWEYGHVAAFAAWLVGFGLLLYAGLRSLQACEER